MNVTENTAMEKRKIIDVTYCLKKSSAFSPDEILAVYRNRKMMISMIHEIKGIKYPINFIYPDNPSQSNQVQVRGC